MFYIYKSSVNNQLLSLPLSLPPNEGTSLKRKYCSIFVDLLSVLYNIVHIGYSTFYFWIEQCPVKVRNTHSSVIIDYKHYKHFFKVIACFFRHTVFIH